MREYDNTLGGLTDLEGNLPGYVPEDSGIWVTDKVSLQNNQKEPYLVFLIPVSFDLKGKSGPVFSLAPQRRLHEEQIRWLNTRILEQAGWIQKLKSENMLNSFALLASAKPEKYLKFAKEWGPLWTRSELPNYLGGEFEDFNGSLVQWAESIATWRFWAKRISAAMEIAGYLRDGRIPPPKLWTDYMLFNMNDEKTKEINPSGRDINYQRNFFALSINIELQGLFSDIPGARHRKGFRFWLDWSGEVPRLKIKLSGFGFINSIYYLLAQAVTQSNICVCDGCGKAYAREGRKPAKGRKNFCPECGDKASKRLWAEKNKK